MTTETNETANNTKRTMFSMESLRIHVCFLVIFAGLLIPTSCLDHCWLPEKHVALFIFGGSLFDAGNNNYINTSVTQQANFWPYGKTFFKYPTGRFSNGRVIPDFIAEYKKLPLIPPYLHPGYYEFTDGVNFASGGSGALVETNRGLTIDLKTQLSYFKNVEDELRQKMGDAEGKKLVSKAVYLFSVGNNDYLTLFVNANSTVLQSYSQKQYVEMVIGNLTSVIKEIYDIGGRKFGLLNVPPLGCAPLAKALAGTGACLEELTALVKLHNAALSQVLQKLEKQLKGFKYSILNAYDSLSDRINDPLKYGFKDGNMACCGSGPYRGVLSCGRTKEYELCENPSEFVYFDSLHPAEKAIQQIVELMWSGASKVSGPYYNLQALFEQ